MLTAPNFSSPTWLNIFVSVFSSQICWKFWLIRKLWDGAVCDHRCNKSRWVLKLCGKTCTKLWGFSDASPEPEGLSEKENNRESKFLHDFPDLVDLNSWCLLFSLASPQGVKVTWTLFTFQSVNISWKCFGMNSTASQCMQWMSLHLGGTAIHLASKTKTKTKNVTSSWLYCKTSCNWSDKDRDRDKKCHFILAVRHYILQLFGQRQRQRQRQRMTLHLGGTALHIAIGRMQAVKESIIQRRSNLPSKISILAGKQSNKRCRRILNLPRSSLRGRKIRYLLLANRKQYWSWVLQQCQPTKGKIFKWKYDIGRIRKTTKPITNFGKIKNHTKGNEQDHLREAVKNCFFLRIIPK